MNTTPKRPAYLKGPVSERALTAQINCALAHEGKELRTARYGSPLYLVVGRHYIQYIGGGPASPGFPDLEELGRNLGVLGENESLMQ